MFTTDFQKTFASLIVTNANANQEITRKGLTTSRVSKFTRCYYNAIAKHCAPHVAVRFQQTPLEIVIAAAPEIAKFILQQEVLFEDYVQKTIAELKAEDVKEGIGVSRTIQLARKEQCYVQFYKALTNDQEGDPFALSAEESVGKKPKLTDEQKEELKKAKAAEREAKKEAAKLAKEQAKEAAKAAKSPAKAEPKADEELFEFEDSPEVSAAETATDDFDEAVPVSANDFDEIPTETESETESATEAETESETESAIEAETESETEIPDVDPVGEELDDFPIDDDEF